MFKITVLLGKIICNEKVYGKGKSFIMVSLTKEIVKQEEQGLVKIERIIRKKDKPGKIKDGL